LFLTRIREHIAVHAPTLIPLFDVMAGEARFARAWMSEDISRLPKGAALLEVGGGVFLLSCQLAREGFAVTAIEPTGNGFGAFEELGKLVLELAAQEAPIPFVARCKAEDYHSETSFDFVYSVNVMEHVDDPERVIARVSAVLRPGASYRFFCPNYRFPYEPHFNIPTFITKQWTEKLMGKKIFANIQMDDPAGVWKSLNWITVGMVRRIVNRDQSLVIQCNAKIFSQMLERSVSDKEFAARRSRWVVAIIRQLVNFRIHRVANLVPVTMQPAMDVQLIKKL
jgi:SAM-dependent methyltransferase